MAPKDSLRLIEEQFMATSDSPSTSMADLDMSEDTPDLTQAPEPGVHVTLGDSTI
ncbi:hypothetical protein [Scytonema hofmannii]|uniref:hypothetical protein n=1 Tax=Scytonema hofmannii TaxID=34078 RepID=UPI00034B13E4|nr:hypothetical protein [Scytonema hofmannii]